MWYHIAAQYDLCNAGQSRILRNLVGNIITVYCFNGCSQLLRQFQIIAQTLPIRLRHPLKLAGFYEQGSKAAPECARHTGRGADDLRVGWRRREAHQNVLLHTV